MRISRLGTFSLCLLASCALGGVLFGQRVLAGQNQLADHLRIYTSILGAVEDNYVEEVKSDKLVSSSIKEMLRTLDPHSNFLETRDYSDLQERQAGSYGGIGLTVQAGDAGINVVAVFESGPAHTIGIRPGDIISHIEGETTQGLSINDAVKRLKGPKGTPVNITVKRQGVDKPLPFTVVRDVIVLHAVPYHFMVSDRVGYVRLTDFNELSACGPREPEGCEREMEKAISDLRRQKAQTIVLDIRDNPGGLLEQAFAVSNLFLRKGQSVVYTRGRNKRDEMSYVTEEDGQFADIPLIVLTSRHSASASEIVAGAIQDHDRGLIVGETTFGKGLVQTIMPLRQVRGYALALTTARYYTPSGRLIQRDYASTSYEDYVSTGKRESCTYVEGDAKTTDGGRKVYGGNGITPDHCSEPPTPSKPMATLLGRGAFVGFARALEASAESDSKLIPGARDLLPVTADFKVTPRVLDMFKAYLDERKLNPGEAVLTAEREFVSRQLTEEVLRQFLGESLAKKASLAWDPQLQQALRFTGEAAALLRDAKARVARGTTAGQ